MAARQGAGARAERVPVTQERVLAAATALADADGIEALSMRRLGRELGVEAMSLYHHVAGKDALLDALVEELVAGINAEVADPGDEDGDWRAVLRARALIARRTMLLHPWLPGVLQGRATMSAAVVRYFDGVVAVLLEGGFGHDLAHHALHALGSRVLGFSPELFDPNAGSGADVALPDPEAMAALAPHLVQMLAAVQHEGPETTIGWCDDQAEFEFGLDVVLDGLDRRRGLAAG